MLIEISRIVVDPRLQMRVATNATAIEEYTLRYVELGADGMDPVELVQAEEGLLLVNGFHRLAAAQAAGLPAVHANVQAGTWRDAWMRALEANVRSSVPLRDEDHARRVHAIVRDPELAAHSNRELAARYGGSRELYRRAKAEAEAAGELVLPDVVRGRDGVEQQRRKKKAEPLDEQAQRQAAIVVRIGALCKSGHTSLTCADGTEEDLRGLERELQGGARLNQATMERLEAALTRLEEHGDAIRRALAQRGPRLRLLEQLRRLGQVGWENHVEGKSVWLWEEDLRALPQDEPMDDTVLGRLAEAVTAAEAAQEARRLKLQDQVHGRLRELQAEGCVALTVSTLQPLISELLRPGLPWPYLQDVDAAIDKEIARRALQVDDEDEAEDLDKDFADEDFADETATPAEEPAVVEEPAAVEAPAVVEEPLDDPTKGQRIAARLVEVHSAMLEALRNQLRRDLHRLQAEGVAVLPGGVPIANRLPFLDSYTEQQLTEAHDEVTQALAEEQTAREGLAARIRVVSNDRCITWRDQEVSPGTAMTCRRRQLPELEAVVAAAEQETAHEARTMATRLRLARQAAGLAAEVAEPDTILVCEIPLPRLVGMLTGDDASPSEVEALAELDLAVVEARLLDLVEQLLRDQEEAARGKACSACATPTRRLETSGDLAYPLCADCALRARDEALTPLRAPALQDVDPVKVDDVWTLPLDASAASIQRLIDRTQARARAHLADAPALARQIRADLDRLLITAQVLGVPVEALRPAGQWAQHQDGVSLPAVTVVTLGAAYSNLTTPPGLRCERGRPWSNGGVGIIEIKLPSVGR